MENVQPYQRTNPNGVPVFFLGKFLSSGNEHRVHLSEDGQWVLKTRGRLGRFWQDMSAQAARRDLEVLNQHAFPIVPTWVFDRALLVRPHQDYEVVDYLMVQPYVPHRPINFLDLKNDAAVREAMAQMMRIREQIYQATGLGVDPLGGRSYRALAKVVERWFRHNAPFLKNGYNLGLNPPIENIIQATQDVVIQGQTLLQRGDVRLADTRLFRQSQQMNALIHRLIVSLLIEPTHHVETGALETALRSLGHDSFSTGHVDPHWGRELGAWVAQQIIDDLMGEPN